MGAASFLPLIVSLLRSELRAQPGPLAYTDVPILKLSPVKPEKQLSSLFQAICSVPVRRVHRDINFGNLKHFT